MPCYSSDQIRKEWQYAVSKDFTKDGVSASWAKGHPTRWGSESFTIKVDRTLNGGAFSHDEKFLALAVGPNVHIYSVQNSFALRTILTASTTEDVDHVQWQPKLPNQDGYMILANASDRSIRHESEIAERLSEQRVILWRLDTFGQNLEIPSEIPFNVDAIAGIAAQEVSSLLQTRYNWHSSDADSPEILKGFTKVLEKARVKHDLKNCIRIAGSPLGGFNSRSFSNGGKFILLIDQLNDDESEAGESGAKLGIWEISHSGATKRFRLNGHTDSIMWAAFSPDDSMVASSCWDETLKLWSATTGELLYSFGPSGAQNWKGAFSPNGKYIAHGKGGSEAGLLVWNIQTHELAYAINDAPGWVRTIAWSPDSKYLACGASGGEVRIIDVEDQEGTIGESGKLLQRWRLDFKALPLASHFMEIRSLFWFDQGKKIVFSTGQDFGVEVYDVEANTKWRFAPQEDDLSDSNLNRAGSSQIIWWKTGRKLLTLDADNTVRFWGLT